MLATTIYVIAAFAVTAIVLSLIIAIASNAPLIGPIVSNQLTQTGQWISAIFSGFTIVILAAIFLLLYRAVRGE